MDISDGLVGDLTKLCAASGVAAEVSLDRLPVRPELREAFPQEWQRLALAGGEDYELLLTGPAEVLAAVQERSDLPLTVIGRITRGPAGRVTVLDEQNKVLDLAPGGWDHFTGG
jgi:thiamine-monophosphate kinase